MRNRRSGAALPPANDRGVDQIPDFLRDIAGGTPLPLVVIWSRSELGAQIDMQTVLGGVPVSGFVKAAWAHYFERDASLTANLVALPGASFTTAGAKPDRDGAIFAAGVNAKLSERVSLGVRLDSELSASNRRLGGTAQLRVRF